MGRLQVTGSENLAAVDDVRVIRPGKANGSAEHR